MWYQLEKIHVNLIKGEKVKIFTDDICVRSFEGDKKH